MTKKNTPGFYIETKTGKKGKIYTTEKFVDGKIVVYVDYMERPLLCKPDSLKITGRFE